MNFSNIYHGGSAKAPGYSMTGGGGVPVSSEFYASLIQSNSQVINATVSIPAPTDGYWNDVRQGWYFGIDYNLKEAHFLYNEFRTTSAFQTVSVNFRRRLADGSGGVWISVYTVVTTFPNSNNFIWSFFGDHVSGLNLLIPAGYYVYAYCSAKTAPFIEGVSIWIQYQKKSS